MATAGLNPNDPELVALVRAADPLRARSVALFAARAALRLHPVTEPEVAEALAAVDVADLAAALSRGESISDLAERQDALYFELLDAADGSYTPAVIQSFGEARALTALAAALKPDPAQAALEAVIEAYAVHDVGSEEFLAQVKDMLQSPDHR